VLDQINGLPGHVLLVHAVVILIPLTCLLLVLAAVSTRLRDRIGVALPALGAVSLVLVPLTVSAGRWLQRRTGSGPLVEKHEQLGEGLLKYAIALLVMSLVVYGTRFAATEGREQHESDRAERASSAGAVTLTLPLRLALAAVSVAVAASTVVQVVRIGDSGAEAVWTGVTQSP
jgi:hypothetical protein